MTVPRFYVSEHDPPAKRQILRAAMKLFSAKGLAATSIRDIADESGFTNPALYKHFASKDDLALHLFETCHQCVWTRCHAAISSARTFDEKLDQYIAAWLELVDEDPQMIAFLSDSARVLWPRAGAAVRRRTMIGLARSLVSAAPRSRRVNADVAAAALQGTLGEITRMLHVGVLKGPAARWRTALVATFRTLLE